MAGNRQVVVFFDTDEESGIVRETLGKDARLYAGQAEADASPQARSGLCWMLA